MKNTVYTINFNKNLDIFLNIFNALAANLVKIAPYYIGNYQTKVKDVQNTTLLGIESSCDDTSAAVLKNGKIVSNIVTGQEVHVKYGGVVPELASRSHHKNIIPVVDLALKEAGVSLSSIDGIAFTKGPGLMGSLMVGHHFAKGLALSLGKPLIAVNHLEAHVLSPLIENENLKFPYLCLLVSGGHTQIVKVNSALSMEVLGKTIDDAAGEAFDKIAKMLGLVYPGGPLIDKFAKEGDPKRFKFNIGKVPELDFSFSGFKTAVLYMLQKSVKEDATFIENNLSDICASVQFTIVDYLMRKLNLAVKQTGIKSISIAGGVAANSGLRQALQENAEGKNWEVFIPSFQYCTDNAGMIVNAGFYKYELKQFSELDEKVFSS